MPIINSLLDIDFYKLTMGQMILTHYPHVPVTLGLRNRTQTVRLADHINEARLRDELNHVQTLGFNKSELHYLGGTNEYQERMFTEPYLEFLAKLQLPDYHLRRVDGNYELEFSGCWAEVTYWETIALAIINELYYQSLLASLSQFAREVIFAQGGLRLWEKIRILKNRPDISFIEFGTRRRFSRDWQTYITEVLATELPKQFLGTSNTELAMKQTLLPMGTLAHELFMVYANIYPVGELGFVNSQRKVLSDWWEQYGWGLSIALSDTYGTDFFLRGIMTREQAQQWKGMRQDSGVPIEIGEKIIKYYESQDIDPRTKMLIFSDGLEIDSVLTLADHFCDRIKVSFGWGTNLTNDLGLAPLSLVVKVISANGRPAVKLSDNLAKAIGQPEDIERFKSLCGYTATTNLAVKY